MRGFEPTCLIRLLPRTSWSLVSMLLATTGLIACGGAAVNARDRTTAAVVRVGARSISASDLGHWMSILVEGDYRDITGHTAPGGLVAEPSDYPACIAALRRLVSQTQDPGTTSSTRSQRELECRQLQSGVKRQALSYLIQGLWDLEEASAHGQAVSNADVARVFAREVAESKRNSAATTFTTLIAGHLLARADIFYLIKRTLLSTRLDELHKRQLGRTVGGEEALQRALAEQYAKRVATWRARTVCTPGYAVPECRGYRAPKAASASPALVLEQVIGAQ
jgi:hypothetical protein